MSSATLVFLGIVAAGSLIQAVALVILFREGLRIVRQLDETQAQLARELTPMVQDLTRATGHLAEVSAVTVGQVRRLEVMVEDFAVRLAGARSIIEDVVLPSATRLMTIVAAVKGVRRAIAFLRARA